MIKAKRRRKSLAMILRAREIEHLKVEMALN
jgi:hypothetical protein